MRWRNESDDCQIRFNHRRKRSHFPRSTDASFNHRKPVVVRIESRKRQRNTQVIVEISLRRQHPVLRPTQQQRQQILGGRFPGAARNADHRPSERATMLASNRLKRRQWIRDNQLRQRETLISTRNQRGTCARILCGSQEIMAVALVGL